MEKKEFHMEEMKSYIEKHNVYNSSLPLGYNIMELGKYAKQKGVKISQLSEEEINLFRSK